MDMKAREGNQLKARQILDRERGFEAALFEAERVRPAGPRPTGRANEEGRSKGGPLLEPCLQGHAGR